MAIGVLLMGLLAVVNPHIRTTVPDLRALMREGEQRSETFRSLVTRLEDSDVVVYVEYHQHSPADVRGFLTFISSAGGRRYLRVRIEWLLAREHQLAILGHELQHAVEIAEAPDVIDEVSLLRFYSRVGTRWEAGARRCFDTRAAVDTGRQVLKELRTREPRAKSVVSEVRNVHDRHAIEPEASRRPTGR
jgi:hypothetical protein